MGNRVAPSTGWLAGLGFAALLAVAAPATANDKHAAMVIDANNGNVMHADQADEPRFPASLTKVMTLYMAFEAIEQGRTSYNARLKVSQEAASAPPTRLDLEPGETITLIEAMKALITKSANDAAVVIAEHLGGTEARFARMMTDKARLFGMSRTTFRNASGLPDPQQVTTARDMLRLALRIQDDFPKHYQLFATRSFTYEGTTYRNHNNLLFRFQGTDGLKTGYTRASGFNLVASVRRGGRHVIGVVMGGRTASRRDDTMQLLLSRALMTSTPYKTRRSAPVLVAAPMQRPRPAGQPAPAVVPTAAAIPAPAVRPQPPQYALAGAGAGTSDAVHPRPVMVPHRSRIITPVADAGAQWPQVVPAPVPAIRPQTARAAPPEDAPQRLALAPRGFDLVRPQQGLALAGVAQSEPGRALAPSTHQQQAASLTRAQDMASPAVPPPASGAAPGGSALVQRGSPPSTLQAQATQLSRQSAAQAPTPRPSLPPTHWRGQEPTPSTSAAPPGNSGYEIQIGAYATAAEAGRALEVARSSGGGMLDARQARVVPVARESRQVFRARFAGFDSRSAASTCIELRRRQVDCFVMRAE